MKNSARVISKIKKINLKLSCVIGYFILMIMDIFITLFTDIPWFKNRSESNKALLRIWNRDT
jgi:hypothetical protein